MITASTATYTRPHRRTCFALLGCCGTLLLLGCATSERSQVEAHLTSTISPSTPDAALLARFNVDERDHLPPAAVVQVDD